MKLDKIKPSDSKLAPIESLFGVMFVSIFLVFLFVLVSYLFIVAARN